MHTGNVFIQRFYAFLSGGDGADSGGDGGGATDSGADLSGDNGDDDGGEIQGEDNRTSISAWGTPPKTKSDEFTKLIPEAYRDKPYLKDAQSLEDVFKQLDNSQSLIGKKTVGLPEEGAPKEDWDKYYESVTPKEATEYAFEEYQVPDDVEGKEVLQTFLADSKDEEFENGLKKVFHDAKLTKAQAAMVQKGANELFMGKFGGLYKEAAERKARENADFDEIATKKFGNRKAAVLEKGHEFLKSHMPEEFKEFIPDLGNKELIAMAAFADSVRQKYVKEDGLITTEGGMAPLSETEISEKGRELMNSEAFNDEFHPQHDKVMRELNDLYQRPNKRQVAKKR